MATTQVNLTADEVKAALVEAAFNHVSGDLGSYGPVTSTVLVCCGKCGLIRSGEAQAQMTFETKAAPEARP